MFLSLPLVKEPCPCVIFFNPILFNTFSNGKNSPNGTNLILLYLKSTSNLLLTISAERGQGDARRPPPIDRHRWRPRSPSPLRRRHGDPREPHRWLGSTVRHAHRAPSRSRRGCRRRRSRPRRPRRVSP